MTVGFGIALRKTMERHHVTQSQLARWSGYDHSYFSRLLSGARNPSRISVDRIIDSLSLDEAQRDDLLSAAGFLPGSANGMLSCPILGDLDQAHRAATPERKAWIEGIAKLALGVQAA